MTTLKKKKKKKKKKKGGKKSNFYGINSFFILILSHLFHVDRHGMNRMVT